VAAGVLCGLLLGLAGVFLMSSLDGRLRHESDVRTYLGLPVLATLPRLTRGFGVPGVDGVPSSPGVEQPYRLLRLRLLPGDLGGRRKGRAVVITSPSGDEGKSTTALRLGASIAGEGHRVIVMEVDLRRPRMWTLAGRPPRKGLIGALEGRFDMRECLVRLQTLGAPRTLQFLLPEDPSDWGTEDPERLLASSGAKALARARELADVVIVDAPPLTSAPDALSFAVHADETLVVARMRQTQTEELHDLLELLASHNRAPAGIALVEGSRRFVQPARGLRTDRANAIPTPAHW
jgi:Mrp family chromosome partitioning ATPase